MCHTPEQPIAMDRRDCPDEESKVELPHELTISHSVHYTENEFAAHIGLSTPNNFVFRPRQVPISTSISFRLTWWSPRPPDNWQTVIANNLPNVEAARFDVGNSPAFEGDSLCGPIGIVVKLKHILSAYASSRGVIMTDVEFRNLGTFLYTKEIMHGILVCMKGDAGVDRSFPLIDVVGTEAFVPCSSREQFIWKVYSTVGYDGVGPTDVFWTWDHVSFGFYCPTSDLCIKNQFCGFTNKRATRYMPKSRPYTNTRSFKQIYVDDNLFHRLRAKANS